MLYFNIYLFNKKNFSQTFILTEWTILLHVSKNAASFKIWALNSSVWVRRINYFFKYI